LVAEIDGKVVGFTTLCRDGDLDLSFVRPDVMRQGIGGVLHAAILSEARIMEMTALTCKASRVSERFFVRPEQRFQADIRVMWEGSTGAIAAPIS